MKKNKPSVFQTHLPFRRRVPERALTGIFVLERSAFGTLGVFFLLGIILYIYFVMLSVSHVVVREEVLREGETLANAVAHLERTYLERSASLTSAKAFTLGFSETLPLFVERGSLSVSNSNSR